MQKEIEVKREPEGWSLCIYSPGAVAIPIQRRNKGNNREQYHIPEEKVDEYFSPPTVSRLMQLKPRDSLAVKRAELIWNSFPEHWLK